MKHRMVNKNRFLAILFAVLLCIVSLSIGVWQAVKGYAEDTCQLTSVAVEKNDGWVFTGNTPNKVLYKMVSVTVTYKETKTGEDAKEESYLLEFTGEKTVEDDTVYYVANTGEHVTFKYSGEQVSVTVKPKKGATVAEDGSDNGEVEVGSYSGGLTLNGIFAEFNANLAPTVYPYSDLSAGYITSSSKGPIDVYQVFNDGSLQIDTTGAYSFKSGETFFPADFTDYTKYTDGYKYNKALIVTSTGTNTTFTSTVEASVVWEGVTFKAPTGLGKSLYGNPLPPQIARSTELDLSGVTVRLEFEDGEIEKEVALSAFKNLLDIEYYIGNNNTDIGELTTKVTSIKITLNYPGTGWVASKTFTGVRVDPLIIHVPGLPNLKSVAWNSDGASIDIGKWDFNNLYKNPPVPVIRATTTDGEKYSSDPKDVESLEYKELSTSLAENEDKKDWVMTVNFPRPGVKYTISVILDSDGDFQWETLPVDMSSYVNRVNNYTLEMNVQVDKGQPIINEITNITAATYGDYHIGENDANYGDVEFTAKITNAEGEEVQMQESDKSGGYVDVEWTYMPLSKAGSVDAYKNEEVYYYYLKYYTAYTDEDNNTPVPDGDLLPNGKPKYAAKYYNVANYIVVLATYENFGYNTATSKKTGSFTVNQFGILASDTTPETFARTEWKLSHFLSLEDGTNAFPNHAPYNEKADELIAITGVNDSNNVKLDTTNAFYNAGVYTVSLSVSNKNYKFTGSKATSDTTAGVTFTIKTNKTSDFSFVKSGWLYDSENAYAVQSVTKTTFDYYPSWSAVGNTTSGKTYIENDFEIEYIYDFGENKGKTVSETELKKFEVGDYIVKLTAKPDTTYKSKHPNFTERAEIADNVSDDTTYDYVLPVKQHSFAVTASPINKPTLGAPWAESKASEGKVYQYNNGASSTPFEFESWIQDNTATSGATIITVKVAHTTFERASYTPVTTTYTFDNTYLTGSGIFAETTVGEGEKKLTFTVCDAGYYVVTIELNSNYSWTAESTGDGEDTEDDAPADATPGADNSPYSYYGYVLRQQLAVLGDGDITNSAGQNNTYNGGQQTKTISTATSGGKWNSDVLQISDVKMEDLYSGQNHLADKEGYGIKENNTFYVTNAGKYTVSVDIKEPSEDNKSANKNNYEWVVADGEDVGADRTNYVLRTLNLVYELEQATLKVQWKAVVNNAEKTVAGTTDFGVFSFKFDGDNSGEQTIPKAVVTGNYDDEELTVTDGDYTRYNYSATDAFNSPVNGNVIKSIGKYVIVVSNFGGAAAPNYKLPDYEHATSLNEVLSACTVFEIVADSFDAPVYTGKNETHIYDSKYLDLTTFIDNYSSYEKGGVYRVALAVTKSGDDDFQAVDGVKIREAGDYTIRISISDPNFDWLSSAIPEGQDAHTYVFEFDFTIEKATIVVTWSENTDATYGIVREYNANGLLTPVYTLNLCENDAGTPDEVYLKLSIGSEVYDKKGQGTIGKLDAGKYTATVTELLGKDSANYEIVAGTGAGKSNDSVKFTVKKKAIKMPTLESATKGFENTDRTFNIPNVGSAYNDDSDLEVVIWVSGEVPSNWFDSVPGGKVTICTDKEVTYTGKANDAVFTYTRAGEYTFVFVITSIKNYHWDGDGSEFDFDGENAIKDTVVEGVYKAGSNAKLTVTRMELTAPALTKTLREQEFDHPQEFSFSGTLSQGDVNVPYAVAYGTAGSDATDGARQDWSGSGNAEQGTYYAELALEKGDANSVLYYLNYKWNNSADPNNGPSAYGSYLNHKDEFFYTQDKVAIRLYYAITLSQLDIHIEFKEGGYTFGDNGYVGVKQTDGDAIEYRSPIIGFEISVGGDSVTATLTTTGTVYLVGNNTSIISGVVTTLNNIRFYNKTKDNQEVKTADLVNGLPWEQGTYVLDGLLVFGDGEQYANLNASCEFTVGKLTIDEEWIKWTDDSNLVYSNSAKTTTAAIDNSVISIKQDESTPYSIGLQFTVGAHNGSDLKNAGSQTVKITGIGNDDNFKLPDSYNSNPFTHTYTISAKAVTVSAVEVDGHVYLDEIIDSGDNSEKKFNHEFFADGAADSVQIEICRNDNTTGTIVSADIIDETAGKGTYYVVVGWKSAAGIHTTNYTVTWESAEFKIIPREITIAWDKDNAKITYGNTKIDLYSYLYVTKTNGDGGSEDLAGITDNKFNAGGMTSSLVKSLINLVAIKFDNSELDAYTDADTYNLKIEKKAFAGENWIFHFTGYSEGSPWQFVIGNADVTANPEDAFTPLSLTYNAGWQAIFANPDVNIVNREDNEEKWEYILTGTTFADAAITGDNIAETWKDFTGAKNLSVYTAGNYKFKIRVTAKNHNEYNTGDEFITFTVAKATLSVHFEFAIMYGEDNPASREYKFDKQGVANDESEYYSNIRTQAVNGKGWTVVSAGFKGSDESKFRSATTGAAFYNLTGDAKYEVNGYNSSACLFGAEKDYEDSYAISYDSFTLSCDNYNFVPVTDSETYSKLKINKIPLTIQGKNLKISYNDPDVADYLVKSGEETESYKVIHPTSSYGGGDYHTEFINYKEYFVVTSTAFTGNTNPTTYGVGDEYTLDIDPQGTSHYYSITGGSSTVEIEATGLSDVNEITGYDKAFDERYHGLSVVIDGKATSTIDENAKTLVRVTGLVFAKASDNIAKVIIEYSVADSEPGKLAEYWSDLSEDDITTDAPGYIDKGTYIIVYKISAGNNYIPEYGCKTINISQAQNSLAQDFDFLKGETDQDKTSKIVKDSSLGNSKVAWIYGYGSGAEGGYDPDSYQEIIEPEATYTRISSSQTAKLKFELKYANYYQGTSGTTKTISVGSVDSVEQLFGDVFGAGEFNAGYYCLTVSMDETANFAAISVDYVFQVARRNLIITAKEGMSVVYGDNAPTSVAMTPDAYSGLVSKGPGHDVDEIKDALSFVNQSEINNTPIFMTRYSAGSTVGGGTGSGANQGKYEIYVYNRVEGEYKELVQNYNPTYVSAWLEVTKREITVTIDDKTTTYNDNANIQPLTFSVVNNSIYNNDKVIELYTEAIVKNSAKQDVTNDVKFENNVKVGYTIYAVYTAYGEQNYVVKFSGCSMKETRERVAYTEGNDTKYRDVIIPTEDVNNAGTYTIDQATAMLTDNGVYHYDGDTDGKTTSGTKIRTNIYSSYVNRYELLLKGAGRNGEDLEIPVTYTNEDGEDVDLVINAGKYNVQGVTANLNYTATGMFKEFEIQEATIYLEVEDAEVQYGTKLYNSADKDLKEGVVKNDGTKGRFTGFKYTAVSGYVDKDNTIKQLPDSIVNYYTAGTEDGAVVTYSYGGYVASTSQVNSEFILKAVCADDYSGNITVDTSNTGTLTVVRREVEVTIVGWNEDKKGDASQHNDQATCYYQGDDHGLLKTAFDNQVSNYRSKFIYTANEKETFGEAAKNYVALGITLKLPDNVVNANDYDISWSDKNAEDGYNFRVTVTNTTMPKFHVKKIELKLSAATSTGLQYGDSISLIISNGSDTGIGKLSYSVTGILKGETFIENCLKEGYRVAFTVKSGTAVYAPWSSGAGNYNVTVGIVKVVKETDTTSYVPVDDYDSIFTNYVITNFAAATLKIDPRVITASTENQIFRFNGTNYNGGLYGDNHEAQIKFNNVWVEGGIAGEQIYAPNGEGDYAPTYTLLYNTPELTNGSNTYQTAGKAPTVVGNYEVYVTLTNSNYIFDTSADRVTNQGKTKALDFNVTPMEISATQLKWKDNPINVPVGSSIDKVSNTMEIYQSAYMDIGAFDYIRTGVSSGVAVQKGSMSELGTYYFDGSGHLCITLDAKATGRYTVRVQLNANAKHNIQLKYGTDNRDYLDITFIVTNKNTTMRVVFTGFEYGEQPDTPEVYINDSEKPETNNLTIRYARIDEDKTTADLDELCSDSESYGGIAEIGSNVKFGNWTPTLNAMAGYYVLYVEYAYYGADDNVSAHRYVVFHVTKKGVDLPIDVKINDLTYNGREQLIQVSFDQYMMSATIEGESGTIVSREIEDSKYKVTFGVTNVGTYGIKFVLTNSTNYEWTSEESDAVQVNGATATYTFKVLKDTVHTVDSTNPVIKFKTGDIQEDYGVALNTSYVEIVNSGYNGGITLYYAVKDSATAPDIEDIEGSWNLYANRPGKLVVGTYWIMARVDDARTEDKYFEYKCVVAQFTVTRKEVNVTVFGEMIYGDELTWDNLDLAFDGFAPGEDLSESFKGPDRKYTWLLAKDITKVDTYEIILKTNLISEEIEGMSSQNYKYTALPGTLIVNKRPITIALEPGAGYYAIEHSTDTLKYSVVTGEGYRDLAKGDTLSDLRIVLAIRDASGNAVTIESDVGIYGFEIVSYDNTNYVISSQRVSYQIKPLEIEIALELNYDEDGNIVYNPDFNHDTDWIVQFDNANSKVITDGFDSKNMKIVEKNLNLSLWYTGLTNGGEQYADSKAPTQAGTYTAQVMGASDNVTLTGMPSIQFTIEKKTLDESLLIIENQTYTGSALTPVITVKDNEYTSDRFSATILQYVYANTYDISVVLTDKNNYKWTYAVDIATVRFTIDKAEVEVTKELTITGWQYGAYSVAVNSPSAAIKEGGTISYEYSSDGVHFSNIVPDTGSVGTYYVRFVVAESANFKYYESKAVPFYITKHYLPVPTITASDGTYTGSELNATISNYDGRYMAVTDDSDARTFVGASSIIAVAVNAGEYKVYIKLSDFTNYGWLEGAGDEQGVVTLTWTIGKMKISLPTSGKNNFIVNGNDIVYIPDGFDASIMSIDKNVYSYGGNFVAIITLKDTANYEWENGEVAIELNWHITGAEVIFFIILGALLALTVAGAVGIVTQILLDKREKKAEADALEALENKDALANGEGTENAESAANAENSESQNTAEGGAK